ncbi:general secretion pathway protein GspK [Opitutales bacterium]|nr:general secretion pathway protein GspK [Opitutales bacterium]MDA8990509.1 general secretion pathway protein GspK [Opitutales bacterium]
MNKVSPRKRGSILVFVLALIVLLSVLSLRLMKETAQELRHVSQFHKRDDLRTYAYSALDLTVGVLNEFRMILGKLDDRGLGWGDPLEYAGISPSDIAATGEEESLNSPITWSVRLLDESGKIPFHEIKEKDLVSLFAFMKAGGDSIVNDDDGEPLVDALADWQDKDDEERDEGAEDDYYEDLDPPYWTPGRKLENFDEFRMIKGFAYDPDDSENSGIFFDEIGNETGDLVNFKDSFSFFNEGGFNPDGASVFLLKFLAGDDEGAFEDLNESRNSSSQSDKKRYYDMIGELANKRGLKIDRSAKVFRLEINVNRGKSNFQLHAILLNEMSSGNRKPIRPKTGQKNLQKPRSARNQKIQYPFRILALRENENLID